MLLHDNPQLLVETLRDQHALVLGELHGDLIARLGECEDRFVDQGDKPRRIAVSVVLLETVLMTRRRRQTKSSTLQCRGHNGFAILMYDGKGTEIGVRRFPTDADGALLELEQYRPSAAQMSFDELGGPIVGGEGTPAPPGYRLYVLWWPGNLVLGGAVLAAGVLTDDTEILYAMTPLPPPIMEGATSGDMAGAGISGVPNITDASSGPVTPPRERRRNADFDENTGDESAQPGKSS